MKTQLFRGYLRVCRAISSIYQSGNPHRIKPKLIWDGAVPVEPDITFETLVKGFRDFEDCICISAHGGAVITRDNHVFSSTIEYPWGKELHPVFSSVLLGRHAGTVERGVFLVTPEAKGNYYHWVVDLLPRLLLTQRYRPEALRDGVLILHHPPATYEAESLKLAGIEESRVVRLRKAELTNVEKLLMPPLVHNDARFPKWKHQLLTDFKKGLLLPQKPGRSVYLVRGSTKKRRLLGEEMLIEELEQRGWSIISPEKLSFSEQMELMHDAKVVAGLHGAALANTVFCQPGTTVLELRSTYCPPNHYTEVAKTCGFRFEPIALHPVASRKKPVHANRTDLLLTPEDLQSILTIVDSL